MLKDSRYIPSIGEIILAIIILVPTTSNTDGNIKILCYVDPNIDCYKTVSCVLVLYITRSNIWEFDMLIIGTPSCKFSILEKNGNYFLFLSKVVYLNM